MTKKVKFGTRTKREALKARPAPYLEYFEKGFHLGYRKGQRGGSWVLRRYLGRDAKPPYVYETIGRADDDPTEADTLSYEAGRSLARKRMEAITGEGEPKKPTPSLTVAKAIEQYVAEREEREAERHGTDKRGMKNDAASRLKRVDDKLAAKSLAEITVDDLTVWRKSLKGLQASTVRRVSNDLRAALNMAAKRHRTKLPASLRDTIRDGLATVVASAPPAREMQVLTDDQVRALVEAAERVDEREGWGGDLAVIVRVMAATGARFIQLARMRVGDVQREKRRLMVPVSHKGRGQKARTHTLIPGPPT